MSIERQNPIPNMKRTNLYDGVAGFANVVTAGGFRVDINDTMESMAERTEDVQTRATTLHSTTGRRRMGVGIRVGRRQLGIGVGCRIHMFIRVRSCSLWC